MNVDEHWTIEKQGLFSGFKVFKRRRANSVPFLCSIRLQCVTSFVLPGNSRNLGCLLRLDLLSFLFFSLCLSCFYFFPYVSRVYSFCVTRRFWLCFLIPATPLLAESLDVRLEGAVKFDRNTWLTVNQLTQSHVAGFIR